ncbi:MAG TPA: hypothetical protein VG297_11625 [Bryobacteraceae bacterium]|nr:hypothetical protein [Bryobacteraceae bacterium]
MPIFESLRPVGISPAAFPGSEALPQDAVAAIATLLSAGPVRDLLQVIEARRFSPDPAQLATLLWTATAAIARHDTPRAMTALAEYIARDPYHSSALVHASVLQPVESEVRELLHRITGEAKAEAQHHFAFARATAEPNSQDVLAVAERMMEAGILAAYIRASELCRSITIPRTAGATGAAGSHAKLPDRLNKAWRRAPLLVLLAGWAMAGIALALIFSRETAAAIWAIGFLILVVLQFLITTRNY